jgi:hypothetical protein
MDIALALDALIPNANYSGSLTANTEEAYTNIIWLETDYDKAKPSWEVVLAKAQELALSAAKSAKKAEIREHSNSCCASGFLYDGQRFRILQANVGEYDAMRTEAKEVLAEDGAWETIQWPVVSGGYYAVDTPEKMIGIADAAKSFRRTCHNNAVAHQQAVDALETTGGVEAYDFSTGWPE